MRGEELEKSERTVLGLWVDRVEERRFCKKFLGEG